MRPRAPAGTPILTEPIRHRERFERARCLNLNSDKLPVEIDLAQTNRIVRQTEGEPGEATEIGYEEIAQQPQLFATLRHAEH